jgi:hypothetical protein
MEVARRSTKIEEAALDKTQLDYKTGETGRGTLSFTS